MIAYADGGCRVNPGGPATWGWLIEDGGVRVAHDSGAIPARPDLTSFVAEYEALVRVLEYVHENGIQLSEVRCDSQVVVRQVRGEYGCNAPHLRPLCDRTRELLVESRASIRWIPREENGPADALTRENPAPSDVSPVVPDEHAPGESCTCTGGFHPKAGTQHCAFHPRWRRSTLDAAQHVATEEGES